MKVEQVWAEDDEFEIKILWDLKLDMTSCCGYVDDT